MDGAELISIVKVMALTGLSRPRLSQLIRLGLFPRPELASRRLWAKPIVLDWVRANREQVVAVAKAPRSLRLGRRGSRI